MSNKDNACPPKPRCQDGDYRPHYPARTADPYMDYVAGRCASHAITIGRLKGVLKRIRDGAGSNAGYTACGCEDHGSLQIAATTRSTAVLNVWQHLHLPNLGRT